MDEQMEALLAVYALGGLTEEEAAEVEAYLAADLQAELALQEMMQTTTMLAHLAPPVRPSVAMERNLFARIEADAAHKTASAAARRDTRSPVTSQMAVSLPFWQHWQQRLRGWLATPLLSGVSLAVAVLILIWALLLNQQLANLNQQNASLSREVQLLQTEKTAVSRQLVQVQQQLATLVAERDSLAAELIGSQTMNISLQAELDNTQAILALLSGQNVHRVSLSGTEAQPQAEAQLLMRPDSHVALLFVSGLQPLAAGQVYQVLLIRDDGHDTAETFAVSVRGQGALVVHAKTPFETFTAVGVSIEPEGGSPQRTGEIILLGSIKS